MAYQLGPIAITGSVIEITGSIAISGSLTGGVTVQNINLSTSSFTIPGGGVYHMTVATDGVLEFPDPSINSGQTIIIINTDTNGATVYTGGGYPPYNASNSIIDTIASQAAYTFVSTGAYWFGWSEK